ncbi:SusC/RagA family TonB-linked outer membrane protein [Pararcticibacter amylolyticus]|nr:SusC/RagA family TonB-linked outer membrane protein [Pararcticibacter amylolyticus]
MRLTTVLLIACLMQVSAAGLAQKITLNVRNIPLTSVLKEIRKQSGYDVFSDGKDFPKNQKVSVVLKEASIEEALDQILKGLNLTYKIEGNTIAVKQKESRNILEKIIAQLQRIDVSGKVLDEKGQPVPGATIRVKDGKGATITDERGNFTIKNVDEGATIVITFIGYDERELKATSNIGTVKLNLATSKLDEVLVQAYGRTSQRLSTGNISSITTKQIENKPIVNPLLALQGEVAGIAVNQASGYANSGIRIQIQGINSMTKGVDPLFVIDGMPFTSQLPTNVTGSGFSGGKDPNLAGIFPTTMGNPLNFLNPQDIESISVLKDADATAIYGSRGSNGVILITTKKGKPGDSKVNLNLQQGVMKAGRFQQLMNRDQYLQMRKDAYFKTDGLLTSSPQWASAYDLNGVWDSNRYTDWQRELLGTAQYSDFSASLEGGNEFDVYRVGAAFHRQSTIFNYTDASDRKGSLSFNLNHMSKNRKFKATLSSQYQLDFNEAPIVDLGVLALQLSPVAPALLNPDGTLNWQPGPSGNSSWTNPIASNKYAKNNGKTSNLITSLNLSYEILDGLNFSSFFGYSNLQLNEFQTSPLKAMSPDAVRAGNKPSSFFNNSSIYGWQVEPQLRYTSNFSKGVLDVQLGTTFQTKYANQQAINASNYANDLLLESMSAAGNLSRSTSDISEYKYNGVFSRIAYNWDNKYLINLSARRDGSSRFGANNLFHNFWGTGAAWIFSEEKLVKSGLPWLSFGKVKASYGTTGNDQIGDYKYLNLYSPNNYEVNYQGQVGLAPEGLPNPNLQWEETRKFSSGLNLGVFKDRILFDVTYYINRSSNQLLSYVLPIITGGNFINANLPATVQNSGWEFNLRSINIKEGNFSWSSNFNISFNRNKLISFPDIEKSSYATTFAIGKSTYSLNAFQYAGVNSQTGLYQFYNAAGNLTSTPDFSKDRTQNIDLLPKFLGGFKNSFTYRGFQLDILFSFAKQRLPNNTFALASRRPGRLFNQLASISGNYWTNSNQIASLQKVSVTGGGGVADGYSNILSSDASISDASFIRLKNLGLSYSIVPNLLEKARIKDLRLFANAQNLFTITKYNGIDPESGNSNLGPLRTIVFGFQLGL